MLVNPFDCFSTKFFKLEKFKHVIIVAWIFLDDFLSSQKGIRETEKRCKSYRLLWPASIQHSPFWYFSTAQKLTIFKAQTKKLKSFQLLSDQILAHWNFKSKLEERGRRWNVSGDKGCGFSGELNKTFKEKKLNKNNIVRIIREKPWIDGERVVGCHVPCSWVFLLFFVAFSDFR